eukprot:532787-Rhodomonas_salina.1
MRGLGGEGRGLTWCAIKILGVGERDRDRHRHRRTHRNTQRHTPVQPHPIFQPHTQTPYQLVTLARGVSAAL